MARKSLITETMPLKSLFHSKIDEVDVELRKLRELLDGYSDTADLCERDLTRLSAFHHSLRSLRMFLNSDRGYNRTK